MISPQSSRWIRVSALILVICAACIAFVLSIKNAQMFAIDGHLESAEQAPVQGTTPMDSVGRTRALEMESIQMGHSELSPDDASSNPRDEQEQWIILGHCRDFSGATIAAAALRFLVEEKTQRREVTVDAGPGGEFSIALGRGAVVLSVLVRTLKSLVTSPVIVDLPSEPEGRQRIVQWDAVCAAPATIVGRIIDSKSGGGLAEIVVSARTNDRTGIPESVGACLSGVGGAFELQVPARLELKISARTMRPEEKNLTGLDRQKLLERVEILSKADVPAWMPSVVRRLLPEESKNAWHPIDKWPLVRCHDGQICGVGDIPLGRASKLIINAHDSDGAPIAGLFVLLRGSYSGAQLLVGPADDLGSIRTEVPPGRRKIIVMLSNGRTEVFQGELSLNPGEDQIVNLVVDRMKMEEGAEVQFECVNLFGSPVTEARIEWEEQSALTDERGWAKLKAGEGRSDSLLAIRHPQFKDKLISMPVLGKESHLRVVLEPAKSSALHVINSDGSLAPEICVLRLKSISSSNVSSMYGISNDGFVMQAKDGVYEIPLEASAVSTYLLVYTSTGYRIVGEQSEIAAGAQTEVLLREMKVLEGRVLSDDRTPVHGAIVQSAPRRIILPEGRNIAKRGCSMPSTVSDASGFFRIYAPLQDGVLYFKRPEGTEMVVEYASWEQPREIRIPASASISLERKTEAKGDLLFAVEFAGSPYIKYRSEGRVLEGASSAEVRVFAIGKYKVTSYNGMEGLEDEFVVYVAESDPHVTITVPR